MNQNASLHVKPLPRRVPEGTIPCWRFEGTAYECGRQYGEACRERRPGYRRYLDKAWGWPDRLSSEARRLIEARCPQIIDVFRGLADAAGPPVAGAVPEPDNGCTSFGVHGSVTLDGHPISGQSKDTLGVSELQYIVLSLSVRDAPDILVLAYPGEVLGYGLWSTGSSLFRNSLYSREPGRGALDKETWGFLALAGVDVDDAAQLALRHGLQGAGNCLISDRQGNVASVEFNGGGVSVLPAQDGICTHANHPEGAETLPFEDYPDPAERANSRYRMHGFRRLLNEERGRLSAVRCLHLLADHTHYPLGICRHQVAGSPDQGTTAVVVAEPTLGRLHVVRGNPCCNWPVTYSLGNEDAAQPHMIPDK